MSTYPLGFQKSHYYAFRLAAENGHLPVVDRLLREVTPERKQAMISADDWYAFIWAAKYGHMPVVDRLLREVTPENKQVMIAAANYDAFRWAAEKGHTPVVDCLLREVAPQRKQEMIADYTWYAFKLAAKYGHMPVVDRLLREVTPENKQRIWAAFGLASAHGHMPVVDLLLREVTPENKQAMIAAKDWDAFRLAAARGHMLVLYRLHEVTTPDIWHNLMRSLHVHNRNLVSDLLEKTSAWKDAYKEIYGRDIPDNEMIAFIELYSGKHADKLNAYKIYEGDVQGTVPLCGDVFDLMTEYLDDGIKPQVILKYLAVTAHPPKSCMQRATAAAQSIAGQCVVM